MIERVCTRLQQSFDLGEGLLLRVAHFDCGTDADRLFATIHHFAVDGMSFGVFWEDLEHAYRQAAEGTSVSLPPKTASFRTWATQLEQLARTSRVIDRAPDWLGLPWGAAARLPTDFDNYPARNTNASAAAVLVEFSMEETNGLLRGRRRPEHAILTALARCLSRWTLSETVLIDVLSHGRDAAFEGVNLSRTLGFALSYNPLVLTHPTWDIDADVLDAVIRQIEAMPEGFTFELLRFMAADPEVRDRFTALPRPDVLFNYAGAEGDPTNGSFWWPAGEPTGPSRSPRGLREHPIAVRASVAPNLRLTFVYSTELHTSMTIEAKASEVADGIRGLIERSLVKS